MLYEMEEWYVYRMFNSEINGQDNKSDPGIFGIKIEIIVTCKPCQAGGYYYEMYLYGFCIFCISCDLNYYKL